MVVTSALFGFGMGLSLIAAIGAQNAYVLRCGLVRQNVALVVVICALSDTILIAIGVGGFGQVLNASPLLVALATWGGAAFLLVYAGFSLKRALRPGTLSPSEMPPQSPRAAALTALAFTWANPHVYLDTVVFLGSLSAPLSGSARLSFGIGAGCASWVWFAGLGFGARLMQPVFATPVAWRVLDLAIAIVMLTIALVMVRPYF